MAETPTHAQYTIAVELTVPTPRGIVARVNHWLLHESETGPFEGAPRPGRRQSPAVQERQTTTLYNGAW